MVQTAEWKWSKLPNGGWGGLGVIDIILSIMIGTYRNRVADLILADLISAKKMSAPKFRMVLTAKGAFAYTRPDGVIVCPIGCLRD